MPRVTEFFRGGPRGGDNFASLLQVLQTPNSKRQKHPFKPQGLQPLRGHPVKHRLTGVKKFLPTTGAAGKRIFQCGCPRFSAQTSMTRGVLEKLYPEKVCVAFLVPNAIPFKITINSNIILSKYNVIFG